MGIFSRGDRPPKRDRVDRILEQETGLEGKDRIRAESKRVKKGKKP